MTTLDNSARVTRKVEMKADANTTIKGEWVIDFSGCELADVLEMAASSIVIAEQNQLRKLVQAKDGTAIAQAKSRTIKVAERTRRSPVRVMTLAETIAALQALPEADRAKYIAALQAKK